MTLVLPSLRSDPPKPSRILRNDAARRVAKWQFASTGVLLVFGVLAALVFQLAAIAPSWRPLAPKAIALHGLTLMHFVWMPGLSMAVAPWLVPSEAGCRQRLSAHRWALALYWIAAMALIGSGCLTTSNHRLGFYWAYLGSGYRLAMVQAGGLAVLAVALAITGWIWLKEDHGARSTQKESSFVSMLATAGFVQVLCAPIAVALPLLMWVERVRGVGLFLPTLGGNPGLLSSTYWLYANPILWVSVLPALGWLDDAILQLTKRPRSATLISSQNGMAISTLVLMTWGIRSDVILGAPARSFFVFTSAVVVLLLVRPCLAASLRLMASSPRDAAARRLLPVAAISTFALLAFIPLILPASAKSLGGTLFETASVHWLVLGTILLPIVQAVRPFDAQPKRSDRGERWATAVLVIGVGLIGGAEAYVGLTARKTVPALALCCTLLALSAIGALAHRSIRRLSRAPQGLVEDLGQLGESENGQDYLSAMRSA